MGQLATAQKVFRRLKHSSEYGRRGGVDQGKPHTLEYALEGVEDHLGMGRGWDNYLG